MGLPLSAWPWENLGAFKYLLYGPLAAKVLHSWIFEEDPNQKDIWCIHILLICVVRAFVHQLWSSYNSMHFLNRHRRINPQGVDFKQIDREWDWDNFIILEALLASMTCLIFPSLCFLPVWNSKGLITLLLLHVTISEPLYYWAHRFFHESYLFTHYHSLHHSSPVIHPFTAGHATFLERLILCIVMGIPMAGSILMGYGSACMIYGYVLAFDFLRCMGHSNVEIFPHRIFNKLPFLRYIIYTPTYHNLHHTKIGTNFCLFMPLFDGIGNTLNANSWQLHRKRGDNEREPKFVFLIHGVDVASANHAPYFFRSFASRPFTSRMFILLLWPYTFVLMLMLWAWATTYVYSFYYLRGSLLQTWAVPRFGFQYFLPFAKKGINKLIEESILQADIMGVKVLGLAGFNKHEALNGGGTLFVNKHPDLKVRVVHGNTLTAAVILNGLPKDVEQVFLTGATSKLGRAIALYLCRRRIRILMLTSSIERFQNIQDEAPVDCQNYLVHVAKYQTAQTCKTWIVGKSITPREQRWAPPGTHFHQFVVPPILAFRRDCTYGDLAAMRLPQDVQGLGNCEYKMDRGVVLACHAGGLIHFLEGWTHHEVGAIDVDKIDLVWEAALKHGLRPILN